MTRMIGLRQFGLTLVLASAVLLPLGLIHPSPADAQEAVKPPTRLPPLGAEPRPDPGDDAEGFSLMEEGAKLLFRGLMAEVEPSINDMSSALREIAPTLQSLGPELEKLLSMMGDIRNYHAPEMQPNGDILIRRRSDAPPLAPHSTPQPQPGRNGEIEL